MTARPTTFVFVGGVLSLLVGCATEPTISHHAKLDPAEERMMTLTQQVEEQSLQIQNLKAAVDTLLSRVREAEEVKPKAKAPPPQATEDSVLEDEGTEAADETISRAETAKPAVAEDSEAKEGATVADSKHEAMHFYYTGLQALEERRYDEALKSLREFLKAAPNHVYADRAEYLIAETHFLNREYGLVVVETNLLESRYPNSFRIPEALWHRALAYVGMNQPESARAALKDLMQKYPKNELAARASRKLAELTSSKRRAPQLMND